MKGKIKTTLLIAVLLISTLTIAIPIASAVEEVDYSLTTTIPIYNRALETDFLLELTVEDDGDWVTWTLDFPKEEWTGDACLNLGLNIALDGEGEGPAIHIHNNDGVDSGFDFGMWLYSEYDGAWHTGTGGNNIPVDSLDWVEASGLRNLSPDGVLTVRIKRAVLGNEFHWSACPTVGSGSGDAYDTTMQVPPAFDWSNEIVDMSQPNYVRALAVTGSGSIDAPSAGTTVTYEGADDDTITIEDLTEDEVGEVTFGAVGEYVDVQLEVGTDIDTLQIRVYYDDTGMESWEEDALIMYWYDGTDWCACSLTGVNTVEDYIWAIITDDTSPSLSQMTGTPFGPGGGLALDSEFYKNVDVITVDVGSTFANDDPIRINTLEVHAESTPTDSVGIDVELEETGVDTGVFTGSFPITDVIPPPVGYLAVDEGDIVTVTYTYNDGEDHTFTDTATIDEKPPEFLDPFVVSDADFFKNGDTITLTISLDTTGYTVTADFSAIDSECTLEEEAIGAYTITYEISEENTMVDGEYTITVTAEDEAGNTATYDFTTNLDNTEPSVTKAVADPSVIQPEEATTVTFTASVSDELSGVALVMIDLTEIGEGAAEEMTEIKVEDVGTGVYEYEGSVEVALAGDYVLPITATDTVGNENALESITFQVTLDTEGPFEVGFTEAAPVCGGLIVRGLYMEDDLTGPGSYEILVDDVTFETITETLLVTTDYGTFGEFDEHVVFKRSIVLDLTGTVDPVSVTLIAYDLVGTAADEIILYEGLIPEGEWAPVELYEGWNLVSLPLIPDSSDSGDVLSLILDQGASGVVVSYGYDQYTDLWIANPADMTDGYGYWLYALDDDVMIVEGTDKLAPPSPPATYEFTEGWVLAGYKQTSTTNEPTGKIEDYLASLEESSYFETIYVWDAATTTWDTLDTTVIGTTDVLSPGMGFWIWMYSDQSLIAPLE